MARNKGWMLVFLGVVLAIGAGVLVFLTLQRQATVATEESRQLALAQFAPPPTMKLPVAARPMEPGVSLTEADFILKDFPLDLVPVSAISDTATLTNKILVQPVGQGETFRSSQFLGNAGAAISQQIEPGNVLFAFPILDLLSKSNLIKDGDRVDLLLTLPVKQAEGQQEGKATAFTLQHIAVFKVLRPPALDDQETEATALLCSVKPEDAVLLKSIKDSGGTIDFVLRSSLDRDTFQTPSIGPEDLRTRFSLR